MNSNHSQIGLINPKYPHNFGGIIRLASCYDIDRIWFTGTRLENQVASLGRIPREERMREYLKVQWINRAQFITEACNDGYTPVAVEFDRRAESLCNFQHPKRALYVFGPEDGTIPKGTLHACHRFVYIPTKHCLNLSTAVATVLYDRYLKQHGEFHAQPQHRFQKAHERARPDA